MSKNERYNHEKEALIKRQHTSFGKLILATEKSAPIISFPNEEKFKFSAHKTNKNPGPIYNNVESAKAVFTKPPTWRIGSAKRKDISDYEKYDYFKHKDRIPFIDRSVNLIKQTKWTHISGGAMNLDNKDHANKSRATTPGPGKYTVRLNSSKPRPPSYYIGEKTNEFAIKLKVGTTEKVGPGKYVTEEKYTSKHSMPSKFSIPKSKRRPLSSTLFTKNETYYLYSAIGRQINSKKQTEVINSIGKEKKFNNTRGIYAQHMSFRPTKVNLYHPKI